MWPLWDWTFLWDETQVLQVKNYSGVFSTFKIFLESFHKAAWHIQISLQFVHHEHPSSLAGRACNPFTEALPSSQQPRAAVWPVAIRYMSSPSLSSHFLSSLKLSCQKDTHTQTHTKFNHLLNWVVVIQYTVYLLFGSTGSKMLINQTPTYIKI